MPAGDGESRTVTFSTQRVMTEAIEGEEIREEESARATQDKDESWVP